MKRKPIIILSVALLAVGIITLGYIIIKNQRPKMLLDRISVEYDAGNYEKALSLSERLPEPYSRCYLSYISHMKDINNWTGSGSELLDWLISFCDDFPDVPSLDDFDRRLIFDNDNIQQIKRQFDEERSSIQSMQHWYPFYYQGQMNFRTEFYSFLDNYRNLYKADPDKDGDISISCEEILLMDKKAGNLCDNAIRDLDSLSRQYIIKDQGDEIIENEKEYISSLLSFFDEHISLSTLYDLDDSDRNKVLIISPEAAENNYDVTTRLILTEIGGEIYSEQFNEAQIVIEMGQKNSAMGYENLSPATLRLIKLIQRVFPGATIKIVDEMYPSIMGSIRAIFSE